MSESSGYSTTPLTSHHSARSATKRAKRIEALRKKLTRYFDLLERMRERTGFSQTNTLSVHWSRGEGGHRILTVDMPADLRLLGVAIQGLPRENAQAVIIKYGVYRNAMAVEVTNKEKAELLGLSLDAFKHRVRKGESLLMARKP